MEKFGFMCAHLPYVTILINRCVTKCNSFFPKKPNALQTASHAKQLSGVPEPHTPTTGLRRDEMKPEKLMAKENMKHETSSDLLASTSCEGH